MSTSTQTLSALPASLYERIGGEPTLTRVAERLYEWMKALPEAAQVHAMHTTDLGETRARLTAFLSGFFGGPDRYRPQFGEPLMRRRHMAFAIGPLERDVWLGCMRHALADVITDPGLREEAFARIAQFAEHMRNRAAAPESA